MLETDVSIQGLGAILSQEQDDGRVHLVAFASKALSPSQKNYSLTELETLAVVWAISHFHSYLYGHRVTQSTLTTLLSKPFLKLLIHPGSMPAGG